MCGYHLGSRYPRRTVRVGDLRFLGAAEAEAQVTWLELASCDELDGCQGGCRIGPRPPLTGLLGLLLHLSGLETTEGSYCVRITLFHDDLAVSSELEGGWRQGCCWCRWSRTTMAGRRRRSVGVQSYTSTKDLWPAQYSKDIPF